MAFKQKASTKKKGPKGKKARAKAKLEKRWGEVNVVDDGSKTKRVGNSRLLGKQKDKTIRWGETTTQTIDGASRKDRDNEVALTKNTKKPRNARRSRHNDGVASSDESSDDDSAAAPVSVNNLLSSIRKSTKNKRITEMRKTSQKMVTDEDSDDEDMGDDKSENESTAEESETEFIEDDFLINDDAGDGDSVEGDDEEATIDFFRQRFHRGTLTQDEMSADPPKPKKVLTGAPFEFHIASSGSDLNDLVFTEKDPAKVKDHWKKCTKSAFQGCRKVLQQQWKGFNRKLFTSSQAPVYAALARYADLFVIADSMKKRNEMHRLDMLHVLNHVLTCRSRVQRHNRQLKDIEKADEDAEGKKEMEEDHDDGRFRDQGFTRPTVLVLLPTRSTCHQFVEDLFKLTGNELENGRNERFETEYGSIPDDESSDEGASKRRKAVLEKKGKEWNELFGDSVNNDDDFKLGIALTPKAAKGKTDKKTSTSNVGIKLYSDFYKSDIIVASPLSLKIATVPGQEEEDDDEEEDGKKADSDYLSSIEICLVQYSDVLLMQNWDHVNDVLALLNQEPQKNNNTDFSRVRNYLLEGQGARWRQLIISSKFMDPFLNSTFNRFGKSLSGSVKMRRPISSDEAAISNVLVPMKQIFQKVPSPSLLKQSESRVDYFAKSILPQLLRQKQKHTMVYVPSYFDFCSLRNLLLKRELPFVSVHEYSRTTEVNRGRARFLQGRSPMLLYTGRCNFFHRHIIKGVRHLIFLGLPEHAEFYSSHVNEIQTNNAVLEEEDPEAAATVSSCLVLCTRYEALALERIVGSDNCTRMLKSPKSTFMFYS